MKTVSELTEAMAAPYSGKTLTVRKGGGKEFTYIPWTAMVRHLTEVFDWDGWGGRNAGVHYDPTSKAYVVAIDLEIYVWDVRANAVRTIPRPGIGVEMVKYDGADSHDAAKGARSDGLVNAGRNLGDAFGLALTPERDATNNGTVQGSAVVTRNGNQSSDEPPTEGQVNTLRKCKVPEDLIRVSTKQQAGTFFDCIFADKKTGAYKFGRKFSNEEALVRAFGQDAVDAALAGAEELPF